MKKILDLSPVHILFGGIIFSFLILLILNSWINDSIKSPQTSTNQQAQTVSVEPKKEDDYAGKKLVRRTWLDPNREYWESAIFVEDKEICRFKSKDNKIIELEGKLPEGNIEFFNQTEGTRGNENFHNNNWHGWYREYYDNGRLKRETKYFEGKKILNKEYFIDGVLHMEEDLTDILYPSDHNEKGIGKVYSRSGKIKYEWQFTHSDPNRFTRAYDKDGNLMEENLFNDRGEKISTRTVPRTQ
jgi:antitoxin component YwqK of YwqJK toxin-antitoxin module